MRLTAKQLAAIKEAFQAYFLASDTIWLFGSRVDDTKKGGDIDLYVETHYEDYDSIFEKKIKFLGMVQRKIGEQKIDLVINSLKENKPRKIYQEARDTGIKLS